jgi:nitroreductase
MCVISPAEKNRILDEILATRRSYRIFRPEFPPEDAIREIIRAGLLAPFAAATIQGSGGEYFRRFFVMKKGSPSMNAVQPLVLQTVQRMAGELARSIRENPELSETAKPFAKRLALFSEKGMVPGVGTAPFYIVAGERMGYPPVELQSLAHCMENMWLKATALGLGFQLISVTSQLSGDVEFCRILGIEPDRYALNGCAIGYPVEPLSPAVRPPVDEVTRWLL